MNIKVNLLVIVLYVICFQDYRVDGTIIIVEDNKGEMRKRQMLIYARNSRLEFNVG